MDGSDQQAGGTNSEVSFELAGGPYAVTAARLALTDLESHVDDSLAFDVRLLVSELVTNSVQHAGVGPDDSIMLVVRLNDELVRVEVRDGGPGFERLVVEWTIAGLPLKGQKELLGRLRLADAETRAWVRSTIDRHLREHQPEAADVT